MKAPNGYRPIAKGPFNRRSDLPQRPGELVLARWARSRLNALSSALGGAGGGIGGRRGRVLAEGCVPSHQRGSSPIQCSGFTCISAAMRASL